MGDADAPFLPPVVPPPLPARGDFAPPVMPPPLPSAPPLYATRNEVSRSAVGTGGGRGPIGGSVGGAPASFEEIRAIHEATTRQLRDRREPATAGRPVLFAIGVLSVVAALALVAGVVVF